MEVEEPSITEALDQAIQMVAARNEKNKVGQFFVSRIETKDK